MDEQSRQEVSGYTSTSTLGNNYPTPMDTLSIASKSSLLRGGRMSQDDYHSRSVFATQTLETVNQPLENRSFMIRTRKEPHHYLSLRSGELKLSLRPDSGSFWYCVKRGGWYGFRNTVSGTYLGHGTAKAASANTICARQRQFSPSEYFTAERDANGGCILNVFRATTKDLIPLCISEDKKSLFPRKEGKTAWEDGGTAWDFIDTEYLHGLEPEGQRSILSIIARAVSFCLGGCNY